MKIPIDPLEWCINREYEEGGGGIRERPGGYAGFAIIEKCKKDLASTRL